jgi:drug/metabolite transporter (DMT)-like permease
MISIGIIFGLLVMVSWGVSDFMQALSAKKIGTMKALFLVNAAELLLTLPFFVYYFQAGTLVFKLDHLIYYGLFAFFELFAFYNLMKALEIGEVSIASPISATYPLVTVILSVIILHEELAILKAAAIIIILCGIFLISGDIKEIKKFHKVNGVKEAIISMLCFGINFFIAGVMVKTIDPISVFIFSILVSQPVIIVYSLMNKGMIRKDDAVNMKYILFGVIGGFIYTVAWLMFNLGMSTELISIVSTISALFPAITVMLALFFLKEKLVMSQKVGIVTILVGIVMISV